MVGALGKMGREVCAAVADDPDCTLAAAVDLKANGESVGALIGQPDLAVRVSSDIETLNEAECDVAVDFTHPSTVMEDVRWCVRHALNVVVGTTGITQSDLDEIRALIEEEGSESNVFVAPNFAVGAVLMMRFAATAARHLPAVEIIELHHDQKADAPSGTALKTAGEIAAGRGADPPAVPTAETIPGVRGGVTNGVRIHSVRLPGLVAHQEVLLGGPGQTLTIRHDSFDRISFMPGVLLAVKAIARRPGLTYGLENLLDI